MKIICDTASLFTPSQQEQYGIKVFPLNVTINQKTYKEFVDIESKEFLDLVLDGGIPQSSQPSIGEVMDFYENCDDEIIALTMADGLSGTYASFEGARQSLDDDKKDKIHVINTTTLCGPEHLLVQKVIQLKEKGCTTQEIINQLQYSMDRNVSFLIPADFSFLKRGGRLTPLAAAIGGLLKIVPVLKQTEDGKRLEKFAIKRTYKSAIMDIIQYLKNMMIDETYTVSISHAGVLEQAQKTKQWLQETFPNTRIEIFDLTPVFITQGGPGCIAIQAIRN